MPDDVSPATPASEAAPEATYEERVDAASEAALLGFFRPTPEERARREAVREALEAEDFRWELWQKPERGQVFGMIRVEDEMQLHVRYYHGGVVKAEREIAHHYLEHLISPRTSAHDEVEDILADHGIDDVVVEEKVFPERMRRDMPGSRTPWKPLVGVAGAVIMGAIWGTKTLLKRD